MTELFRFRLSHHKYHSSTSHPYKDALDTFGQKTGQHPLTTLLPLPTDTLREETLQILRLQPEQNEVTGHSSADNTIESEAPDPVPAPVPAPGPAPAPAPAPATAPAAEPFRPRPAVAAPTGEVLATADGVISGLGADCETRECAMGRLIADAIKWRVSGDGRCDGWWVDE